MLSIPSAALQIVLMLGLAKSSEYFNERAFHCLIGEIWSLPMFVALLTLPATSHSWARFTLTTMISGYPYFHPVVSAWISENSFSVKKRAITAATYNVIVQMGSVVGSQIYRADDQPYYYRGNKVCISILALTLVVLVAQRPVAGVAQQTEGEGLGCQCRLRTRRSITPMSTRGRRDGNARLEFRFKY